MSTEIAVLESELRNEELSRVERKRRDARLRIIRAAEALMEAQSVDAVTIADITRAADVGHGSFYLHFKSKYEVLIPVIQERAAAWDAFVQGHLSAKDDPARVVAFTARHMARAALRDPLWRWFLTHSGVPVEDMRAAIGRFSARDFRAGFASGRFQVPDIEVCNRYMLGAYVSTLLGCMDLDEAAAGQAIDAMVELLLRTVGLDVEEAAEIAHQPLDELALSPKTN